MNVNSLLYTFLYRQLQNLYGPKSCLIFCQNRSKKLSNSCLFFWHAAFFIFFNEKRQILTSRFNWSQVENRRSYNIASVRHVRTSGTDYLRNRSKDFFEIWHEVGEQNYKKRHMAAFLNFRLIKAGLACWL